MGRDRMPVRRKVFRIETQLADARPSAAEAVAIPPHHLAAELAALRALVEGRRASPPNIHTKIRTEMDADNAGAGNLEALSLRQLKDETDTIHRAITRTKQE